MKIKTWFIWIITGTVGLFLLIQICFYFMFQNWNINMRDSLIEAAANRSVSQITELYNSVEDVCVNIITDAYVQNYLFYAETERTRENYNFIANNISSVIFANKSIKYVAILDESDILFNVAQAESMIPYLAILDNVESDIAKTPQRNSFVKAYQHQMTNCFASVERIRPLNFDRKIQKHCYLVVMFEISEFENSLESVFDQSKFTLRVLDYNDKILLSANSDEFGRVFVPAEHAPNSWYKTVKMEQPTWNLCLSIPKTYFGSSETSFLIFMLIAIILNVLLLIFMIKILIQNISESISDIEKEMGIISSGEWGHRILYQRNNEIGSIAAKLNVLLDEYEAMVSKNREMEEKVHTARLLQLQAQIEQLQEKISPHFLYNSMEYIKGVAQENGVDKIADITSVLSQNFRYNMDASKPSTVKEDLFYALSYFNVVNSRRKHPIRLNLNLSKEIMEQQIIKMVFQPVLENTLKHGDLGENGTVEFLGEFTDGDLVRISVRDNGQGIQPDRLEKLQASLREDVNYIKDEKGDHQGILNVHTRLKLTYGPECGISIYSIPGEGTEVVVTIRQSRKAIEE